VWYSLNQLHMEQTSTRVGTLVEYGINTVPGFASDVRTTVQIMLIFSRSREKRMIYKSLHRIPCLYLSGGYRFGKCFREPYPDSCFSGVENSVLVI
jgi:hypothetical protein